MPNPRTKSKSPPHIGLVTTDEAAQPEVDESDTAPAIPPLSAVTAPPLTHEQRRRLRHKLMRKYH